MKKAKKFLSLMMMAFLLFPMTVHGQAPSLDPASFLYELAFQSSLIDSQGTKHTIRIYNFKDHSQDEMELTLLDESDHSTPKDAFDSWEFFTLDKGVLQLKKSCEFDTSGQQRYFGTVILPKKDFADSENLYIRYGVTAKSGDTPTDVIQWSTMNNFYANLKHPDKPVVNTVYNLDRIVRGKTLPNTRVFVKAKDIIIGGGDSNGNGEFWIDIDPNQQTGTVLKVYVIDNYGFQSEDTVLTVQEYDQTPPAILVVHDFSDHDTEIIGTTEEKALIKVLNGDTLLNSGYADDAGHFSIPIGLQQAGTKLTVGSIDAFGNVTKIFVTVQDKTPPKKPAANAFGDNQTNITGSAEKESTVYVQKGNQVIGKAVSKGSFTVPIPKQKAGTLLTIFSIDHAGNKSDLITLKVLDYTPPELSVNSVTSKSKTLTGKAETSAVITVYKGTKKIGSATANSKGNFSVKIAAQTKGTKLSIIAQDKAANKSKAKMIVVK